MKRAFDFGLPSELEYAKAQLSETLGAELAKHPAKQLRLRASMCGHYLDGGVLSSVESRVNAKKAMMPEITADNITAALRSMSQSRRDAEW